MGCIPLPQINEIIKYCKIFNNCDRVNYLFGDYFGWYFNLMTLHLAL